MNSRVALIPARSGSKRIPDKNIKDFFGHPLMAYTIQSAKDSKLFSRIIVSSDSDKYLSIAQKYGANIHRRSKLASTDVAPDIMWLDEVFSEKSDKAADEIWELIFILRPTNPFRGFREISQAYGWYCIHDWYGPLKSVNPVSQHPYKMWKIMDGLNPLMISAFQGGYHTQQTKTLPKYYIQNGAIEIRHVNRYDVTYDNHFLPYVMNDYITSLDINSELDWILAEELVKRGMAKLPEIKV